MMKLSAEVAKAVLEESAVLNTDMSEQYSALREYAKGTKIKLSEQQKKEIAYYYGSYDKFRRKNFGKIRLSEEGSTLDSLGRRSLNRIRTSLSRCRRS